jgi:hypothetical protein
MLPTAELTDIRNELESCLPDSGTILALTRTSDGQGGWSESWGGTVSVTGAALTPYSKAIVTLPQATVITEQNRFVHSSGTYTVQAVNMGSWLGVKRATVEKI